MRSFKSIGKQALLAGLAAFGLAACDNDDDPAPAPPPPPPPPPAMASYDVTVTNLTNAQPLSPVAVIAHQEGYSVFSIGTPATAGLENLAEGVRFGLKNRLSDATLTGISEIRIDDQQVPLADVELRLGDDVSVAPADVDPERDHGATISTSISMRGVHASASKSAGGTKLATRNPLTMVSNHGDMPI